MSKYFFLMVAAIVAYGLNPGNASAACQGCQCSGSTDIFPVTSQDACTAGCAAFEYVCSDSIKHGHGTPHKIHVVTGGVRAFDATCYPTVAYGGGTLTGSLPDRLCVPPSVGNRPGGPPCYGHLGCK